MTNRNKPLTPNICHFDCCKVCYLNQSPNSLTPTAHSPPQAVLFTDSDLAMKAAFAAVWSTTLHFLCIWHLSKNMLSNVRPACGANEELWHRVLGAWWRICKQSDVSSIATFDAEWAALGAILGESTVVGKSMDTARAWLVKQAEQRKQWAARFTWAFLTLNMHSTQRIEAVHSAVAGFLRASMLLTMLLSKLDAHGEDVANRAATRAFRHERLLQAADKCNPHPFVNQAAGVLSPYALTLFKGQLQQAAFYKVEPTDTEGTFIVTRMPTSAPSGLSASILDVCAAAEDADVGLSSGLFESPARKTTYLGCSCQFLTSTGLPCRHMLQLSIVQQKVLLLDMLHMRWRPQSQGQLRSLVELMLKIKPVRGGRGGEVTVLTRDDRWGLLMTACRGLADVAASSMPRYEECQTAIAALTAQVRGNASSAGPLRRAGPTAQQVGGARLALPAAPSGATAPARSLQCHACWEFGHNSSNSRCSRLGMAALPKPGVHARSGRKRAPPLSGEEEEEEDSSGTDSGMNDTVCHKCSTPGDLVCCSSCPLSFHEACLPGDAMQLGEEGEAWSCPVCAGSTVAGGFVGNPRHNRPRGGQRQRRLKPATEPSKAQIRERKTAVAASKGKAARFR